MSNLQTCVKLFRETEPLKFMSMDDPKFQTLWNMESDLDNLHSTLTKKEKVKYQKLIKQVPE